MKQKPPPMFFVKIDGAAVSEHDGSLSSAENKLVTQRCGHEFERRKPFVVEMGALARPSDIQVISEPDSSNGETNTKNRFTAMR